MRPFLAAAALITVALAACAGEGGPPPVTPAPSATALPEAAATPLPLSGRVTLYAVDEDDRGGTVAAGDFNGDGVKDVLFAAGLADGPDNGRPDAGEAYVFLGPFQQGDVRDAAAGEQDATIFGADEGDQTGRAAAAADLNGDGIDDIILGAPFGDGPDGARQDSGEVHVVFGSPRLGRDVRTVDLRRDAHHTIYGRAPEDLAGFAVAAADLNADSVADLVIGAFWADGPRRERPNAGEVYVLFGSANGADEVDLAATDPDVTVYGAATADTLGESVATGDVNGDGLDDLVLPAPFAPGAQGQSAAGQTYVIYSTPPPQLDLATATADSTIYGVDEGDQLGHSVVTGDTDGDGVEEILLGAVSADGPENAVNLAGEVALIRGSPLPATIDVAAGQASTLIYGADATDRLGRSTTVADIDGDGRVELFLVAPGGDGERNASPDSGEVHSLPGGNALEKVVRLPDGARLFVGDDAGDLLASAVYGRPAIVAADMDGDGREEVLIAAPRGDGPNNGRPDCGEAYILFPASR